MNYIREELLRQQELLVVLLTGRTVHTPSEELQATERETWRETMPTPEWENDISTRAEATDGVIRPRETADLAAETFLRTAGGNNAGEMAALRAGLETLLTGQTTSQEAMLRVPARQRSAAGHRAEMEDGSFSGGGTMDMAALSTAMTGLPAGTAETGAVRLVTELRRTGGGGPSDAAALSRAFQRDARRYDGGFRLY